VSAERDPQGVKDGNAPWLILLAIILVDAGLDGCEFTNGRPPPAINQGR
jgi:hypothetical protein